MNGEITQKDFVQMSGAYSSERNQLQETAKEMIQKISQAQRNSGINIHIPYCEKQPRVIN
ncbi:MAG: hypothetical protein K2I80_06610 [Ruminococcus sp.]|nr:hypothetical protein [Ruminococcus sp.]